MIGNVTIGNTEVGMNATASSPIRYRKIFGRDFFVESVRENPDPYLYVEMGYVMHRMYDNTIAQASYDDYVEWLDSFEPVDALDAVSDIAALWSASRKTMTQPKKK